MFHPYQLLSVLEKQQTPSWTAMANQFLIGIPGRPISFPVKSNIGINSQSL